MRTRHFILFTKLHIQLESCDDIKLRASICASGHTSTSDRSFTYTQVKFNETI